ncbi:hypothetical protein AMS68_000449 [Peltaster fructicola]|uniref:Ubiquitin carboxyl-terminal hydrolase n=1 Tax=Peltaster fructicola TaxID=286661 RepID=A0A6H0XJN6_9PEZI|nr:hypothetical protein AMS68_000449 [Peltaster fructicola]
MPEKSLTIAAYAAGASLAAATLVYVFGPTFFLDEVDASANSDRKRIAIGLTNPANDCFINSTLQALAGLPALRLYLIRELHQRQLDGKDVYLALGAGGEEKQKTFDESRPQWLRLSLQSGELTAALKEVLDALNERPISRKTISAQPFITAMEHAFKTKVSRYQQDAQELLQLVLERLADEFNAGVKARRRARATDTEKQAELDAATTALAQLEVADSSAIQGSKAPDLQHDKEAAPEAPEPELSFQGKLSSQIECSTCHFKPKPATTTFVTLTLNVPHNTTSTSLDACLDGMLKVEHIDDFRCDLCRLEHASQMVQRQLTKSSLTSEQRQSLETDQRRIDEAIATDPEHPPKDLQLPDPAAAPKRKITRYMRISTFPQVLTIHLSRSVWDGSSTSSKNTAKVSFPELLQLGSLLDRKSYKLLSMITHKGGHNSGHYETFRRQWLAPSPLNDEKSTSLEEPSQVTPISSPRISFAGRDEGVTEKEDLAVLDSPKGHARSGSGHIKTHSTGAAASRLITHSPRLKATSQAKLAERKRKAQDRWWRISDDKVKECRISDVLDMKREVYLLFYQLVEAQIG